ncbi:MAG TPA: two-component regulator propeller domain-containing protein, partial [Pedobacter sp.]
MFKSLLAFCIFLTLLNKASAQTDAVNFDYIKIEGSGLDVPISSIYRDSRGYMWFGNNSSRTLYQFDGYDFKGFRSDPEDPKSLSSEAA